MSATAAADSASAAAPLPPLAAASQPASSLHPSVSSAPTLSAPSLPSPIDSDSHWDDDDEDGGEGAARMAADRAARQHTQERQVLVPVKKKGSSNSQQREGEAESSESDSSSGISGSSMSSSSDSSSSSSSDDEDAQPRVRPSPRLPAATTTSMPPLPSFNLGPNSCAAPASSLSPPAPSLLSDALANPSRPIVSPVPSHNRASSPTTAHHANSSHSANVIMIPIKCTKKSNEQTIKEEEEEEQEEEIDDEEEMEADEQEEEAEDAAADEEEIGDESAQPQLQIIKTEPGVKQEGRKIVFTIPKLSPAATAAAAPTAALPSHPSTLLPPPAPLIASDNTASTPAAAISAAPSTAASTSSSPALHTRPYHHSGLSAASAAHSRINEADESDMMDDADHPLLSVIPPVTAHTPQGRLMLARYRSYFIDRDPAWPVIDVPLYHGAEIDGEWARNNGLRRPFLVSDVQALGLKLPPADLLTVEGVVSSLPADQELSVIDVATQTESSAWTLDQWLKYFQTPVAERTAICNVISLEISRTEFAKQYMEPPRFVRQIDWMNEWPTEIKLDHPPAAENHSQQAKKVRPQSKGYKPLTEAQYEEAAAAAAAAALAPSPPAAVATSSAAAAAPASSPVSSPPAAPLPLIYTQTVPPAIPVQLYCLMGAAGSYTDFHADFGGSSVWYHVVSGRKLFLVVEPTASNLAVYHAWMNSGAKQLREFLADKYAERDAAEMSEEERAAKPTVQLLEVKAGQTLFVPGGWIHAVYTPEDTLVFGGNFLHSFHITSHLVIYNLELDTGVESKYQFPNFESLHWLMLRVYALKLRAGSARETSAVSLAELHGLATLVKTAANWMRQCAVAAVYGYDASRPRRPDVHEEDHIEAHHLAYEYALDSAESAALSGHELLIWAHNIPFSWSDALLLLRELDLRIIQCTYLLEREEYEDKVGQDASFATSEESVPHDVWSRREQLAQRCFQELTTMPTSSYPLTELIQPQSLSFLKRPPRRKVNKMTAAESAATIAGAAPRIRRVKQEEEEEEILPPLPPTASGRIRSHVRKYARGFVNDNDADYGESDNEGMDGGAAAGKDGDHTHTADASRAQQIKRKRVDEERDEEEYGSDSDMSEEESGSDAEFEDESKHRSKRRRPTSGVGVSRRGASSSSSSAAPPVPVPVPSAPLVVAQPGSFNLAEVRARARAAAKAAASASKNAKAAFTQIIAGNTKKETNTKKNATILSTKERIMSKLAKLK